MCTSTLVLAQDGMKKDAMHNDAMKSDMKSMDANGDGMISKDEYMKSSGATAAKWDAMSKNKDGMVDMKAMQMEHDKMMKDDGMMKADPNKKDGGGH